MIEKNLTKEQIAELRPMDEQKVVLTSGKKVEEIDVDAKEQKPVKTLQLGNSQKREATEPLPVTLMPLPSTVTLVPGLAEIVSLLTIAIPSPAL